MAQITIHRIHQQANFYRAIHLFLDGKKLNDILNNETKTYQIAAGKHLLQAKIDLCKTTFEVNIKDDEQKQIKLGSPVFQKLPIYAMLLAIFCFTGMAFYEYFKIEMIYWITGLLIISGLTFQTFFSKDKNLFYYLTFGRDKYLYLREI